MNLGISGRKALIAGGSAGLGRATAESLAREGVEVLISARNEDRLRDAAKAIADEVGREVKYVAADHSTKEGRATLLAACPAPDILVTTISPPSATSDFREISDVDWMEAFQSGAVGPIELMRGVIEGMANRKWGRIVNITTAASKYPKERRLLSGAPRSALSNYTSVVARKMIEHNVVINNLLPSLFATEGLIKAAKWPADEPQQSREMRRKEFAANWGIPGGRMGDPKDFGNIAAMFCAEFASFVVGQNLAIDGGAGSAIF